MSTKENKLKKKKDHASKKRVSCPVIPFYNIKKESKEEEDNYDNILPDIKENSSDESSEEENKNINQNDKKKK